MIMKNLKRVFLVMLITAVMLCAAAPAYATNNFEVQNASKNTIATCETFEQAVAAVPLGGRILAYVNITLNSNVTLPDGSCIVVSGSVTINTNGYTLSGKDTATASAALINVDPGSSLTVTGSGTVSYSAINDRGWNAYSSVISNQRGNVSIDGATINHLGGTAMAYGIDNLTNGDGTTATTTVNSGYVGSTYRAIRQFANGAGAAENVVTIKGGTISGTNKGIWIQDPNNKENAAELIVNAGSVNSVYVYVEGNSDLNAKVSVAAGSVGAVTASNIPAGKILANVNGTYKLYDSVQEAFNEAGAGGSVSLTHAVTLTSDVDVPNGVTVNLNGNDISGKNLKLDEGESMKLTGSGSATVNSTPVSGGNNVTAGSGGVSAVPVPAGGNAAPAVPAAPVVENIYYVPATADNSNMALWSVLALALLSTAFVTRKKKAEN